MKGADGTGWQHSQGKRLSAWPPPPTANACKVKIYKMKRYLLILSVLIMLFVACSHDDDGGVPSGENLETVKLYISVPGVQSTRMGDPGTAVPEGEDWDELAIIMAYTDTDDSQVTLPNNKVQVTTISKEDFEKLPIYGNTNYRLLSIDAQPGTVYIYGVTYSDAADNNPSSDISNCKTNEAVQALTISNDYSKQVDGTIDYAKFVSVATGYYKESGNGPAEFVIKEGGTGEVGSIPTMTLTRLAAKIDIQWDAADAYDKGYTDVKVTRFTYKGTKYGRLFPNIASSNYSAEKQDWTFYNTLEISQRNGRVYHYTFPDGTYIYGTATADGVTVPSVTFNISAIPNGQTTTNTYTYTLNFQSALQKATWYKVNAWIKGITGNGTIELDMSSTGS